MESPVSKIPIFQKRSSRAIFRTKSVSAPTISLKIPCDCSHVLLADDDRFQGFYYQTLFQQSLHFDPLSIQKKDFRFSLSICGEELLSEFKESKKNCRCKAPLLVIVDYNMGPGKMNGIETILALRKEGYKGLIILRTSETYQFLIERHPNLNDLIESKVLNFLLGKNDHRETKNTIQALLQQIFP